MFITKSKYISGVQCLKRLYLGVHSPELAAQPDESGQSIIEQGLKVGLLARKMFPGGVTVDSRDREEAIRATRHLIQNPDIPAIFEGAFEYRDVFVRVDILQRRRDQSWRLLEVKSTASVKDYHLADVAIQHKVVTGSGVDLAESCLAHVNRNYIHQGGIIDVHEFFKIIDLTHQIQGLQPELIVQLRSQFHVLAMPEAPPIPAGRQCTDPFTCEFYDNCNDPVADDHISRLPRIHASTVTKLSALGVESIHDIPESYQLTVRLRRACTSVQTRTAWYGPELKDELGKLTYPLYFADFETINPAIPRFAGMHPYGQIPFQWSVHVQQQPGAAPDHFEFLANDTSDPRPAFISTLSDALGDSGSIVVYSQQFESQRLSELAACLPEFAGRITKIQRRLWDLLPIVRDHIYHPKFGGSFSLKSVLPALVPEMTYEGMEVGDGQAAGLAWESLLRGGLSGSEREKIRKALLDYCGQDTQALFAITHKLMSSA
jgi:Domain of unknown function(DUF2779)